MQKVYIKMYTVEECLNLRNLGKLEKPRETLVKLWKPEEPRETLVKIGKP